MDLVDGDLSFSSPGAGERPDLVFLVAEIVLKGERTLDPYFLVPDVADGKMGDEGVLLRVNRQELGDGNPAALVKIMEACGRFLVSCVGEFIALNQVGHFFD